MTYIASRLVQAVLIMLGVSTALFVLLHAMPGGPAELLAGSNAPPETVAAINASLGLDRPLATQYVDWIGGVVHGDLGESIVYQVPVASLIGQVFAPTAQLMVASLAIAILFGITVGVVSALRAGGTSDFVLRGVTSVFLAVPPFWTGLIAVLILAVELKWLPPGGYASFLDDPAAATRTLLMPAMTLGLLLGSVIARFTRASMLEALHGDYVRLAKAKGAPPRIVVVRHALRNALIPVLTVIGIQIAGLIGGAVVIEQVFNRPGMGTLLVEAIDARDYPVVQGVTIVAVAAFVLVNLMVDLTYSVVDPRIRRDSA